MTDFWRRFVSDPKREPIHYPDPRQETAEKAAYRLEHLEHAMTAVGHKIEKVYSISPKPSPEEHKWAADMGRHIAQYWLNEHYNDEPLKDNSELQQAVAGAIAQATTDYLDLFYLYKHLLPPLPETPRDPNHQGLFTVWRKKAERAPRPCERVREPMPHENVTKGYEAYRDRTTANLLYEIYANHVTNAAEARLIASGVDALKAHRINGYIIRNSVDSAQAFIQEDVYIAPAQGRPKTDLDAIRQVDRLHTFHRSLTTVLNERLGHHTRH